MQRHIIHVDMDAFFASVEQRDHPELRGRPVIVGGTPEGRGVVAAASYEARRFGIHSAMATATALRRCPRAVVLPPRHAHYARVSESIHAIFQRYTPVIEPLSLDEAFLDVTGSLRLFDSATAIGRAIKAAILEELDLVASVGVAPNKFLAKLASDLEKPDGFVEVSSEGVTALLDPLPATRLWGVGPVAARQLERLGIRTIGELRQRAPGELARALGASAEALWQLAHGIDARPVVAEQAASSISNEITFPRDIRDSAELRAWLAELSEQVGWRLRQQGLQGRTVTLKVRFADFSTVTRSRSLSAPTDVTTTLRDVAVALYRTRLEHPHPPVRLVGVGVSGFAAPQPEQGSLFDAPAQEHREIDTLVDTVRARFGRAALYRGRKPRNG